MSTAGCYDIWIAVLDTGCRISHNDLAGGIVNKYAVDVTQKDGSGNYVKLENLNKPYDSDHGTLCAGIVAAKPKNATGIAGAARGWEKDACRVIPIKVSAGLRADKKEKITAASICAGMKHAVNSGAEVISMSISGPASEWYDEAISYAKRAEVVIVTSAGNDNNSDKNYPAAMDYVIGVGGTDGSASNNRAYFSSYGDWVNIVAPATGYVSTSVENNNAYKTNIQGTSFATPLVASTVGLMLSMNPFLTVDQIKNILYSTSTNINSPYFKCGMLNAGLAVQKAKYQSFQSSKVTLTSATALSGNKIKLKWNDINVYGPERVLIYRSTSLNGTYSKIKSLSWTGSESTSYTDSGLKKGKTYYYKVRYAMKYGSGYKYTPYSEVRSAKAKK